jgi:hypothetical protein
MLQSGCGKRSGRRPPQAVLVDPEGLALRGIAGILRTVAADRRRDTWRRSQGRGVRLEQGLGARSDAGTGVQDGHPRRVAAGCAARGLLVGEARQSSEVTPVGARQVAAIGARQMPGDSRGQSRFQRGEAEVQPCLPTAWAGLENDARREAVRAQGFQHARWSDIEIQQHIAGVPLSGVRVNVDVTSLSVAPAEKPDGGCMRQLGCGPQAFPWEGSARGVMNQTDQIQIVRHGRELATNGLPGKKKSAVLHVTMLRWNGTEYNLFQANGNCVFSFVSHRRGSPQDRRSSAFICGLKF